MKIFPLETVNLTLSDEKRTAKCYDDLACVRSTKQADNRLSSFRSSRRSKLFVQSTTVFPFAARDITCR